ncbi:MAG: LON peptidase substrate-binding domain-containing protein, partial [Verrucomicrobiota bacterium]
QQMGFRVPAIVIGPYAKHLIIQGLTRVEMAGAVRYRPYRVQRIKPLQSLPGDRARLDPLLAKVRDLVTERIELGFKFPFPISAALGEKKSPSSLTVKEIVRYLDKMHDADQLADLVSCALLSGATQRQTILETVDVEPRLKFLIHFLMAEIKQHRKDNP